MNQTTIAKTSFSQLDLYNWLGILVGVVMPVLSAVIYATYMHQMQPEWAEWTRLFELPFVACEIIVIHVAIRRGYTDGEVWKKLPRDVIVAAALLLVGLVVSSVMVSKKPAVSILLSITTLVHLRFCAAIFFMARSTSNEKCTALFLWLGYGLVALTILTTWKFQRPPPEWTVPGGKIEWASALPGFINVRHFGSWSGAIASGLMVTILYGQKTQPHSTRLFYMLAAGLTLWSGTRAAVLAMVVVTSLVGISLRRMPYKSSLLQIGGLSALAALGAYIFSTGLPAFMLFQKDDVQSADAFVAGRFELWCASFARWREAPIFGWGSGSTFWEVNIGWAHTQPHNVFVQFLISWGIVGAAGGVWLLVRAIISTHRTGMDEEQLRGLTAMLYGLLFMSLLEGMLFYPRFIMLVAISFAVLFAAREQRSW